MKLINTIVLLLLFTNLQAQNNSPLTAKGTGLLTNTFSFSAQGGELYEDQNSQVTRITLNLAYLHFISNRFGAGVDASYSKGNIGGDQQKAWIGGLKLGYFFDYGKKTIPYLSLALGYQQIQFDEFSSVKIEGFRTTPAIGILINKKQIGFMFESGVYFDQLVIKDKPSQGHTIYVSLGIAVSLFSNRSTSN